MGWIELQQFVKDRRPGSALAHNKDGFTHGLFPQHGMSRMPIFQLQALTHGLIQARLGDQATKGGEGRFFFQ